MEKIKEPFVHVTRRTDVSNGKKLWIRFLSIILGLVVGCLLLLITSGANPFMVISELFNGCFGTGRRIWNLLREIFLLLIVGLALSPAFKMKFWNLGGNGQILMSALITTICMMYLGQAGWADWQINLIMIPAAILAGIIWAVIPAIFKAYFNTNESLFTLMLNYVAVGIIEIFLQCVAPNGSGSLGIVKTGWLVQIGPDGFVGRDSILTILVGLVLLFVIFYYLKFTKHGYELQIVGESQNTARYVGVNVKKVIIRTVIVSGALCGIVGLLLAGSINHSVSSTCDNNMGFTAIMVAWLAKFDPFAMVGTSFIICFFNNGMSQVRTSLGITNDSLSAIILGIIYFFIIGSEFFINYELHFKETKFTRGMHKVFSPINNFFNKIGAGIVSLCNKISTKVSSLFVRKESK